MCGGQNEGRGFRYVPMSVYNFFLWKSALVLLIRHPFPFYQAVGLKHVPDSFSPVLELQKLTTQFSFLHGHWRFSSFLCKYFWSTGPSTLPFSPHQTCQYYNIHVLFTLVNSLRHFQKHLSTRLTKGSKNGKLFKKYPGLETLMFSNMTQIGWTRLYSFHIDLIAMQRRAVMT